jgi:acyl-CoA thioesterase I
MVKLSSYLRYCSVLWMLLLVSGFSWATTAPQRPVILILGDSLSAEYGLQRGTGWVALLEQRLQARKIPALIVNSSISGDTTSGGRSRLPALLQQHRPDLVIIELGGNDALRGLPLQLSTDNLRAMAQMARVQSARVMLLGMQVPPNYGKAYAADFAAMFKTVAQQEKVTLVPFFLKGVADVPQANTLFQPDRIHPNEAAQPIMLQTVWPTLEKELRQLGKTRNMP